MAVLTSKQLDACREGMYQDGVSVTYTKSQMNAALQAVEDKFESVRASFSTAIDTATAPLVLTLAQKKKVFAYWALSKFAIER